jgi:hypothetical protein
MNDIFGVGRTTWIIAIVAAIASGWGYLQLRDMRSEQRGAAKAIVKVERANEQIKGKGKAAATKSAASRPNDRGVLPLDFRD